MLAYRFLLDVDRRMVWAVVKSWVLRRPVALTVPIYDGRYEDAAESPLPGERPLTPPGRTLQ